MSELASDTLSETLPAFVGPADCTMEQMIDHCAQFTDEMNKHTGLNFTPEQAKEQMRQFFPHLKRWKK